MTHYTQEELEIIKDLEDGNYTPLVGKEFDEMKAMLESTAKNTLHRISERKAVSIRIFKEDIPRIQKIALNEGIPYQTLITSILHKFAKGELRN